MVVFSGEGVEGSTEHPSKYFFLQYFLEYTSKFQYFWRKKNHNLYKTSKYSSNIMYLLYKKHIYLTCRRGDWFPLYSQIVMNDALTITMNNIKILIVSFGLLNILNSDKDKINSKRKISTLCRRNNVNNNILTVHVLAVFLKTILAIFESVFSF